jgi:AcrR family transcriptional regulator
MTSSAPPEPAPAPAPAPAPIPARSAPVPGPGRPVIGLRERKKARTRAAIRSQAIRMFAENGYLNTTVEQIAEAADISPSTFFRYFPTKEAVITTDEQDSLIMAAFRQQPAEQSPIRAFRNAVKAVMLQGSPSPEEEEQERLRMMLVNTVPVLRAAMIEQFALSLDDLAEGIAARVGGSPDDFRIRTTAGALIGVAMSVSLDIWRVEQLTIDLPGLVARFDAAMELLEQGLPL